MPSKSRSAIMETLMEGSWVFGLTVECTIDVDSFPRGISVDHIFSHVSGIIEIDSIKRMDIGI